jgi:hypothetical protein
VDVEEPVVACVAVVPFVALVAFVFALVLRVKDVRFVVTAGFVPSCLLAENAITVTIRRTSESESGREIQIDYDNAGI